MKPTLQPITEKPQVKFHFPAAKLIFNLPVQGSDIPRFRGAIAEKAGLEHNLFHNHLTEPAPAKLSKDAEHLLRAAEAHTVAIYENAYIHRYPLIQYRLLGCNAGIVAYGEGVQALAQFLARYDGKLKMSGRVHRADVIRWERNELAVEYSEKLMEYYLWNWVPLNSANFREWTEMPRLSDQLTQLERILRNQIFAFASGIGWRVPQHLDVFITNKKREKRMNIRGKVRPVFDITFRTNLVLPPGIAIGKHVAEGYGRCVPL